MVQRSLPLVQRSLPLVQRSLPLVQLAKHSIRSFAALDMDSDDEDDIITDITEDCDTISTNVSCIPTVITYASVCEGFAKPKAEQNLDSLSRISKGNPTTNASVKIHISCSKSSIPQEFVVLNTNKNLAHSWADDDYWNDEE